MPKKMDGDKSSASRPRTFEKIRKSSMVPSRGIHWRKPLDLVAHVAQMDGLQHTQVAYESEFWDLMKAPPSLRESHARLQRLMTILGLIRIEPFKLRTAFEYTKELNDANCYIFALGQSLNGMGWLDRLSLLALLTREADLVGNTEIAKITRSFYDENADLFFSRFFPAEVAGDYYQSAVMGYCFGDRKVTTSEMGLRLRLESESCKSIIRMR